MVKFLIAVMCTVSIAYANSNFIGIYDLDVKINGKNFTDILEIKRISNTLFFGDFEVPGVFKVPIVGKITGKEILGSFIAVERGGRFEVVLKAVARKKGGFLEGELLTDNQIFGVFTGRKRGCNE